MAQKFNVRNTHAPRIRRERGPTLCEAHRILRGATHEPLFDGALVVHHVRFGKIRKLVDEEDIHLHLAGSACLWWGLNTGIAAAGMRALPLGTSTLGRRDKHVPDSASPKAWLTAPYTPIVLAAFISFFAPREVIA
jgi:hypothetical protein